MSRMTNDEFIAYATKRYIQVKKTRHDIINLYNELRFILKNYWDWGMITIADYTDLRAINVELYGYFYEIAIFRGDE